MPDFWRDSGYHLLRRTAQGHLAVTDDFLRAYFLRPEVRPLEDSCARERALHEALLNNPREAVPAARLAALADADARDNYALVLRFRDRLLAAGTVEACYLATFRPGPRVSGPAAGIDIPPIFVDQMAHVILRAVLDGCDDALRARAGESLFRAQKIEINDGAIMAADAETVAIHAVAGGQDPPGGVGAKRGAGRAVELEILGQANADLYWSRDQRYDTALDLSFASAGLDALCRVLEAWVRHFLDVKVGIQPVQRISDEKWVWHIGLDSEGSALLNDLYNGIAADEARLARLLSLFRLEFADPDDMRPDIAGRPVYLAMAMTPGNILRLKPQNLLVNLPLAARA